MKMPSGKQWAWLAGAAITGWIASGIFSGLLHWSRTRFVLAYGVLVVAFLAVYFQAAGIQPGTQLRRRWVSGAIGGLVLGVLLAWAVSSQPSSARPQGLDLVGVLAWYGVVYGTIDALLLNVVPVLIIYGSRSREELHHGAGRVGWGLAALAGSLLVTATYHLGFEEFRGPLLVQPLIGNLAITTAYLLTGNPLASIIGHVIMHLAAVVHGMETTSQLPPHY